MTGYEIGLSYADRLSKSELCYVCKEPFFRRHFYYEKLCLRCADLNFRKRYQSADLSGQIALVTGARVKIGYATTLKLLRAGTEVIATSRFPRDAARRYAREPDFPEWKNRLHLYGLDLRDLRRLEQFIQHLYETYSGLDILVNNAAQTVRRPPAYYAHLLPLESAPLLELSSLWRSLLEPPHNDQYTLQHVQPVAIDPSPPASNIARESVSFPAGQYDEHEQQIDNREFNSWVMRLEEVPMLEIVEVHLINAVAPALLAGQLKELMQTRSERNRYIVNVSAAEGRFAQDKAGYHPHTNMAKAALNMLTRSIAEDYADAHIFVNSVDPGWVSDQFPHTSNESRLQARERLPLDLTDAAARVCDPVFSQLRISGKLLKDYHIVDW
ncbi:MAG TPA: SDR family oxidoreductase [Oculatellaceae cyanobacterium]